MAFSQQHENTLPKQTHTPSEHLLRRMILEQQGEEKEQRAFQLGLPVLQQHHPTSESCINSSTDHASSLVNRSCCTASDLSADPTFVESQVHDILDDLYKRRLRRADKLLKKVKDMADPSRQTAERMQRAHKYINKVVNKSHYKAMLSSLDELSLDVKQAPVAKQRSSTAGTFDIGDDIARRKEVFRKLRSRSTLKERRAERMKSREESARRQEAFFTSALSFARELRRIKARSMSMNGFRSVSRVPLPGLEDVPAALERRPFFADVPSGLGGLFPSESRRVDPQVNASSFDDQSMETVADAMPQTSPGFQG